MNSLQLSLVVLGLVLVFGTFSGEAIKCYVCNSHKYYEGDDCMDEDKMGQYLIDCDEYALKENYPEFLNATKCRKIDQTVGDEDRIVRSCAQNGRLDRCVDRTGTKAIRVKYCECEGDGCNSASGVFASVFTITVTAVLSRLALH